MHLSLWPEANGEASDKRIKKGGINISEIHSDLEQSERESVMGAFTVGHIKVLVATDILSRGLI